MKKILYLLFATITILLPQDFYNVDINWTGQSQLIIFQESITGLEVGDEIGIFDNSAIIDELGTTGELLVGPALEEGTASAIWTGIQLNPVAIGSYDLSQFGGPLLPGYQEGNSVVIKIYRPSTEVEYNTSITYSAGTGTFGDLFMAISEINILLGDGCTDPEACNYNESALVDDGSCAYEQDCFGVCGGLAIEDCNGDCNGLAQLDNCDVCSGGLTDITPNADQDCNGDCFGSAIEDCLGECNGDAIIDECGICDGNNADQDCNGDCFGSAELDACGYCDGLETNPDNCISYNQEIQPIFDVHCASCHSYGGQAYYQVFLTSYDALMATETWYNDNVVIPGDSENSVLIHTLEGTGTVPQMPFYQDPLGQEVIDLIALWIDQGALNDNNDDGGGGGGDDSSCLDGEIEDCDGNCFSADLIGDGNCNNGANGGANFYCPEFVFDCALSLIECDQIPDCPVGELYFGDLNQEQNRLPVYMDCQYPINSYTFAISGLDGITLTGGMLSDPDLITESDPIVNSNETITWTFTENSLPSNYGLLFYVEFNSILSDVCFSESYITTSVNIEYEADYGDCIIFDSLDNDNILNPTTFTLKPAFPNPFNPIINIPFSLSRVLDVKINIYDINGNRIDNITNQIYSPGDYNLIWDASGFSSGTYFIAVEFGGEVKQQKIVLMK